MSEECANYGDMKEEYKEECIDYSDIDKECQSLVKAMNRLPGIHTEESCCGHGETPYMIFFKQEDFAPARGLAFLGKLMSPRYYSGGSTWSLTLHEVTDRGSYGCFLLQGPVGERGYREAEDMAKIINRAIDENEWPLKS